MSQNPKNDFVEWQESSYKVGLNIDTIEGSPKFKHRLSAIPELTDEGADPYALSGIVRMMMFLNMKWLNPISPEGYSTLVMKAKVHGATTILGYAYWRTGKEREPPEYIAISPTFDSRDGEYRHHFVQAKSFLTTYEKLASDLMPIEEAVLEMVAANTLNLNSYGYPLNKLDDIIVSAEVLRLPVLAAVVSLLLHRESIHTSRDYTKFYSTVTGNTPGLKEMISKAEEKGEYVIMFARTVAAGGVYRMVECGQKLIPMHTREVMEPFDDRYGTWRELRLMQLAGDLVVNSVAPGFSVFNQWAYIEGVDADLFENKAMADRFRRGGAAEASSASLREARRRLEALEPTYHSERYSALLYESLEYAQSFLLMSSTALLATMEHVGLTLGTYGMLLKKKTYPFTPELFSNADKLTHLLWGYVYGAHCLHGKLGIVHTDLHANNMTVHHWGYPTHYRQSAPVGHRPRYHDPRTVYVAGPRGEPDTYLFPSTGHNGSIIDFSRAILGPAFQFDSRHAPGYAANYYRDQVDRVMRAFARYAPEFMRSRETAVRAAVLANFEVVFPILCAVDFIAIGQNFVAALEDIAAHDAEVSPEAYAVAQAVEAKGRELLIRGLYDLTAAGRGTMRAPELPGFTVIAAVFEPWSYRKQEPKFTSSTKLCDAYNYNNPLKYSSTDYARYPPWARLEEIEAHLGGRKLTDFLRRGPDPFLESLQPSARVEVLAELARAEQARLNGPPVSAMSSWLDE